MAKRTRAGDATTAVAYLRVSTDTDRQALGVEAQRAAIAAWASREGVRVVDWFVEEVSGGATLDRRPVLLAALAAVEAQRAGRLLVQRLDRFSREPLTAALAEAQLRRCGAALVCVDGAGSGDDPTSELVRGILLAVGRFEKAMIRARITAALAVKQSRGELTGAAPYGWRRGDDGLHLVEDEHEQRVLAMVRELRAAKYSLRAIVRELASRGVTSRAGKAFGLAQVHAMAAPERPCMS